MIKDAIIRTCLSRRDEDLHILDRFHIVAKMNKALDEVRAGESRRMASEGRTPLLKKSRWLLLKREENLKAEQRFRLRDLIRYNLSTDHAFPHRAREEDRPLAPSASGADSQLFPGPKADFQWGRGGPEQQGQS